jgi:hypothetical protein
MKTTVELENKLIDEAMTISGQNTPGSVIVMALQEYIRANNRKKILLYRGKNIWEGNLNEMRTLE